MDDSKMKHWFSMPFKNGDEDNTQGQLLQKTQTKN